MIATLPLPFYHNIGDLCYNGFQYINGKCYKYYHEADDLSECSSDTLKSGKILGYRTPEFEVKQNYFLRKSALDFFHSQGLGTISSLISKVDQNITDTLENLSN